MLTAGGTRACLPVNLQVCLLTNPIWLVKTRLQLQRLPLTGAAPAAAAAAAGGRPAAAATQLYNGFLDALVRIGREEGLRGYYKGLGPSLVLVSGATDTGVGAVWS